MPSGDVYDDGNVKLAIVRAGRDTNGELLEMAATYAPGSRPPPLHYHPEQEETFDVRAGALSFAIGGAEKIVSAGERIVVPPLAPHAARNASGKEPAQVTWITRPALRTEEMFRAIYDWQRRGGGVLPMAVIAREYRRELLLAKLPRAVQTCVFALLAPVGRALGYRLPAS